MFLILKSNGARLCKDDCWRHFADFGDWPNCVKEYKTKGRAQRMANRVGGLVVEIPGPDPDTGERFAVNAAGMVIRHTPTEEGFERVTHQSLFDFVLKG